MDQTYSCQCQHPCHYDNSIPDPKGGPGHPSTELFPAEQMVVIPTPNGSRVVCGECFTNCYNFSLLDGASIAAALAHVEPAEPRHYSGVCEECGERSGHLVERRPDWLVCPSCAAKPTAQNN